MRYLIKVMVNGINYIPLWKKTNKVGWKCELTSGTKSVCIVCSPRKYKEEE